jgi:hypothetical protein
MKGEMKMITISIEDGGIGTLVLEISDEQEELISEFESSKVNIDSGEKPTLVGQACLNYITDVVTTLENRNLQSKVEEFKIALVEQPEEVKDIYTQLVAIREKAKIKLEPLPVEPVVPIEPIEPIEPVIILKKG